MLTIRRVITVVWELDETEETRCVILVIVDVVNLLDLHLKTKHIACILLNVRQILRFDLLN